MNSDPKPEFRPLVDIDGTTSEGPSLETLREEMRRAIADMEPSLDRWPATSADSTELYDDPVKACAKLDQLNAQFYWMCFRAGVGSFAHAFLEFNGLMSKYVSCLRKAKVPPHAVNVHSEALFKVEDHDIEYLGEKLECIFAPIIAANPNAKAILSRRLFGG